MATHRDWDRWMLTKWANYDPTGRPLIQDPNALVQIVGGPDDGKLVAVPDWRGLRYVEPMASPLHTSRARQLREETFMLHLMAQPVRRLVDDAARPALGIGF